MGTVSVTRTGDRDLRRGSTIVLSGGIGGGGGGSVSSGRGGAGGVRRDIDRIFEGSSPGGEKKSLALLHWDHLIFFFWGRGEKWGCLVICTSGFVFTSGLLRGGGGHSLVEMGLCVNF